MSDEPLSLPVCLCVVLMCCLSVRCVSVCVCRIQVAEIRDTILRSTNFKAVAEAHLQSVYVENDREHTEQLRRLAELYSLGEVEQVRCVDVDVRIVPEKR